MTIYATPTTETAPAVLDFALNIGRPSTTRFMTDDDRCRAEARLVVSLRAHVKTVAAHCLHQSPTEYAAVVADLTGVCTGGTPTGRDVQLAYLLHAYADYVPSPEVVFVDDRYGFNLDGCHAWLSPDGVVVIDVVTTRLFTELDPEADNDFVMQALRAAKRSFGERVLGVRLISLDCPDESVMFVPPGLAAPLTYYKNPFGLTGSGGAR